MRCRVAEDMVALITRMAYRRNRTQGISNKGDCREKKKHFSKHCVLKMLTQICCVCFSTELLKLEGTGTDIKLNFPFGVL